MAVISKALMGIATRASLPLRPLTWPAAALRCGRFPPRLVPALRQRGVGLLSALLGLVIASIITTGIIQGKLAETQQSAGRLQADLLMQVQDAVNTYTLENYPALQSNLAVTKNGLTLAVGSTDGQSLSPTIANLITMGYLSPGTNPTAYLGGNYRVRLRQEPAGCVGVACNIPGMVYIDQAMTRAGSNEMQGVTVGALMNRVGGDVMVSLNTNPAVLTAVNGANVANPVAGTPAGVVGAKVGFGASGYGQFLTLNDPRDPNFQGGMTVAGTIRSTTGSVGAGNGTSAAGAACSLGEILNSGQIVSRTSTCIRRAFIDGSTGQVGVADATGTPRALLDGSTGHLASYDATGTQRSVMGFNGAGQSIVSSDNLSNTAGTGGIDATGKVKGTSGDITTLNAQQANLANATLTAQALIGAGCTQEGAMAWGLNGTSWTMARCTSGVWGNAGGLSQANAGAACPTEGAAAVSGTGQVLYCSGNQWGYLGDRMGRNVLAESFLVDVNGSVPKPGCLSGSIGSAIYLTPSDEAQKVQYLTRYTIDTGSAWTVKAKNQDNVDVPSKLIAQTYCLY